MTTPVVAIFTAKAGMEAQLEALLEGLIDTTLQEAGCISYQLNRDVQNPRRFVFTEVWASQAYLDRHGAAPHLVALRGQLPALIDAADVIVLEALAGGAGGV
jgi:quinol monooxygenase YgiN